MGSPPVCSRTHVPRGCSSLVCQGMCIALAEPDAADFPAVLSNGQRLVFQGAAVEQKSGRPFS